jgi:hypothetical protein
MSRPATEGNATFNMVLQVVIFVAILVVVVGGVESLRTDLKAIQPCTQK